MGLSKQEVDILSKLRDARITKDVLVSLTQIMKEIIKRRPKTKE